MSVDARLTGLRPELAEAEAAAGAAKALNGQVAQLTTEIPPPRGGGASSPHEVDGPDGRAPRACKLHVIGG